MAKRFATAINCMDGRTQEPIIKYIKHNFGVDYIDMITEPGPNRILSEGKIKNSIESIRNKIEISVNRHDSKLIVIAGHYDCAGNPSNEDVQKEDLRKAVDVIESWKYPVNNILALWLDNNFKPSIVSERILVS